MCVEEGRMNVEGRIIQNSTRNISIPYLLTVIVLKNFINEFLLTSHHLTYFNPHNVTCPQT